MFHGPTFQGVASMDRVGADGAEATLRIPQLPGKTFAGRVLSWDAWRVVAEIDNPERLLQDGMRGTLVVEGRQ